MLLLRPDRQLASLPPEKKPASRNAARLSHKGGRARAPAPLSHRVRGVVLRFSAMLLLLLMLATSDRFAALFFDDGQAILEAAPQITLMAIEPHSTTDAGDQWMAEDAQPARCFNPRHAIHAAHGDRQVDLMICFECRQIRSWVNGKQGGCLVSESAEKTFDEL